MNYSNMEETLIILLSILLLLLAIKFLFSNFGKEAKKLGNEILKIGIISEAVVFLFLISPAISSIITITIVGIGIFLHYKKKNNS